MLSSFVLEHDLPVLEDGGTDGAAGGNGGPVSELLVARDVARPSKQIHNLQNLVNICTYNMKFSSTCHVFLLKRLRLKGTTY